MTKSFGLEEERGAEADILKDLISANNAQGQQVHNGTRKLTLFLNLLMSH